jgi:hypothetical protein
MHYDTPYTFAVLRMQKEQTKEKENEKEKEKEARTCKRRETDEWDLRLTTRVQRLKAGVKSQPPCMHASMCLCMNGKGRKW